MFLSFFFDFERRHALSALDNTFNLKNSIIVGKVAFFSYLIISCIDRYWTKGGALRNVPIGGGCRKNKKMKTSSSSTRFSGDSKDTISGSSDIGGLKFFHGLSPAMDFQLGGLNFPRLSNNTSTSTVGGNIFNQFSSFGENSTPNIGSTSCFSLDPSGSSSLLGFNNNFPFSSSMLKQGNKQFNCLVCVSLHVFNV